MTPRVLGYRITGRRIVVGYETNGLIGKLTMDKEPGGGEWVPGDADRLVAEIVSASRTLRAGERRRTRRFRLPHSRSLWVHVNTGPPTWWKPRVFRDPDGTLVAGWFRGLVAVSVRRDRT